MLKVGDQVTIGSKISGIIVKMLYGGQEVLIEQRGGARVATAVTNVTLLNPAPESPEPKNEPKETEG